MHTNPDRSRNTILAGLGLASLLVYVLACTSFSPDDRKVLFPAFDPEHGGVSAMVYDRKTHKTEAVYVRVNLPEPGGTNRSGVLMRPQWCPDGKHILVAVPETGTDGLVLTVVPCGVREPVRVLHVPEAYHVGDSIVQPLPILGSEVFVAASKQKALLGIDLVTGKTRAREFTNEVSLYPDPAGKALLGWMQSGEADKEGTFGRFDLKTLAFQPLVELLEHNTGSDAGCFVFSADPARYLLLSESGEKGTFGLVGFYPDRCQFIRNFEAGAQGIKLAPTAALSPRGDCLYTSFMRPGPGGTNCEYGLLEVPFTQAPPRWTTLIRAEKGDAGDVLFFEGGLSHDGRVWAVSSAYLWAQNQHLQNADSALFLVDLGDAKRAVTRIPIPVPPSRKGLLKD